MSSISITTKKFPSHTSKAPSADDAADTTAPATKPGNNATVKGGPTLARGGASADVVGKIDFLNAAEASLALITNLALKDLDPDAKSHSSHGGPELTQPKNSADTAEKNKVVTSFNSQEEFDDLSTSSVADPAATDSGSRSAASVSSSTTSPADATTRALLPAKTKLSAQGQLTELLGKLISILGKSSLDNLTAQLAILQQQMNGSKEQMTTLSQQYQQAVQTFSDANQGLQTATTQLQQAKEVAVAAQQQVNVAQKQLNGLKSTDPSYAAAQQALATAQSAFKTADDNYNAAQTAALTLQSEAQQASNNADSVMENVHLLINQYNQVPTPAHLALNKQHLSGAAQMLEIMATLMLTLSKNNQQELKNQADLNRKMQEARQADMKKQSDKYEAELRKQAEISKATGCAGKVLGGLLMVVGAIGAVVSMGTSMALFAVGMALTVVDAVVKAATGVSIIEKAMTPISLAMQKLAQAIGSLVTKALEAAGVPKEKAQMVGSIMGAILAVVAVVALMVVGSVVAKGAAARFGGALSKVIGNTVSKMIPDILKKVMSDVSSTLTQAMTKLTDKLERLASETIRAQIANAMKVAGIGVGVTKQANDSGGKIAVADSARIAASNLANILHAQSVAKMMSDFIDSIVQRAGQAYSLETALAKGMSAIIDTDNAAGLSVIRSSTKQA